MIVIKESDSSAGPGAPQPSRCLRRRTSRVQMVRGLTAVTLSCRPSSAGGVTMINTTLAFRPQAGGMTHSFTQRSQFVHALS